MKRLVLTIIALAVLLTAGCKSPTGAQKPLPGVEGGAALHIVVNGIRPPEGVVRVALFDSPEGFPGEDGSELRHAEMPADGETVRVTFTGLPPGRYAVSVYHDLDSNGRMETDRFGRPLERYGTSNNVRGLFGPPTFAAAALTVADSPREIEITLVGTDE